MSIKFYSIDCYWVASVNLRLIRSMFHSGRACLEWEALIDKAPPTRETYCSLEIYTLLLLLPLSSTSCSHPRWWCSCFERLAAPWDSSMLLLALADDSSDFASGWLRTTLTLSQICRSDITRDVPTIPTCANDHDMISCMHGWLMTIDDESSCPILNVPLAQIVNIRYLQVNITLQAQKLDCYAQDCQGLAALRYKPYCNRFKEKQGTIKEAYDYWYIRCLRTFLHSPVFNNDTDISRP